MNKTISTPYTDYNLELQNYILTIPITYGKPSINMVTLSASSITISGVNFYNDTSVITVSYDLIECVIVSAGYNEIICNPWTEEFPYNGIQTVGYVYVKIGDDVATLGTAPVIQTPIINNGVSYGDAMVSTCTCIREIVNDHMNR